MCPPTFYSPLAVRWSHVCCSGYQAVSGSDEYRIWSEEFKTLSKLPTSQLPVVETMDLTYEVLQCLGSLRDSGDKLPIDLYLVSCMDEKETSALPNH